MEDFNFKEEGGKQGRIIKSKQKLFSKFGTKNSLKSTHIFKIKYIQRGGILKNKYSLTLEIQIFNLKQIHLLNKLASNQVTRLAL